VTTKKERKSTERITRDQKYYLEEWLFKNANRVFNRMELDDAFPVLRQRQITHWLWAARKRYPGFEMLGKGQYILNEPPRPQEVPRAYVVQATVATENPNAQFTEVGTTSDGITLLQNNVDGEIWAAYKVGELPYVG
jgi:hypothetical protein